jgi:hypothetical protein
MSKLEYDEFSSYHNKALVIEDGEIPSNFSRELLPIIISIFYLNANTMFS